MLLGIFSDTHDHLEYIDSAIRLFNARNVDRVLHAGDFVSPFAVKRFKDIVAPMDAIFGNNDGEKLGVMATFRNVGKNLHPLHFESDLNGFKILMMHEPKQIEALAKSGIYHAIIYGHTHELDNRVMDSTLILNPGEGCGWLTGKATVAILDTQTRKVEIINLIRG